MIGILVAGLLLGGAGAASATSWQDLGLPPGAVRGRAPAADRGGMLGRFSDEGDASLGIWRHRVDPGGWELVGLEGVLPVTAIRVTGSDQDTLLVSCTAWPPPDTLFYVSTDAGVTWTGKPALPEAVDILGAGRRKAGIIYAISFHRGIYRSTDLGDTWQVTDFGGGGYWWDIEPLPADDRHAFALYRSFYLSMMRTTNGGDDWWPDWDFNYLSGNVNDFMGGDLTSSIRYPNEIFVVSERWLYRLVDGVEWQAREMPPGVYFRSCEIPLWAPGRIYAAGVRIGGGTFAAFRSDDLGETWEEISEGLPESSDVSSPRLLSAPDEPRIYFYRDYPNPPLFLMREEPMPAEVSGTRESFVRRVEVRPNPSMDRVRIVVQGVAAGSPAGSSSLEPLAVFAPTGRRVRFLSAAERTGEGLLTFEWDLRDARGEPVPAGVYFVKAGGRRLEANAVHVLR